MIISLRGFLKINFRGKYRKPTVFLKALSKDFALFYFPSFRTLENLLFLDM